MQKSKKKTYKKRYHMKSKSRSKTNKYTKKRGGKTTNYKPIPLPTIPASTDNTIQDIMDETVNLVDYGGKPRSKSKKYYKGGFKTDTVDNLEDRDDDWIRTKQ